MSEAHAVLERQDALGRFLDATAKARRAAGAGDQTVADVVEAAGAGHEDDVGPRGDRPDGGGPDRRACEHGVGLDRVGDDDAPEAEPPAQQLAEDGRRL